jgi:hypothetical protein
MATFERVEVGKIALIQQNEEGRVFQIGLTPEQSDMLQLFLAMISQEKPLVNMPEEYDIVIKSTHLNK